MSFDWTDAAIDELRRLRADGLSFSACAEAMQRRFGAPVSRNACIGKAGRLGVPGNKQSVAQRREPPRRRVPTVRNFVRSLPTRPARAPESAFGEATELPPDQSPFAVRLLDLTEYHCRWPLGDPRAPDFMFCGAPPRNGLPYCMRHCQLAYQPPQERRPQNERGRRESYNPRRRSEAP